MYFCLFFYKYNVLLFVLFNRDMMVNLYKLFFQPNKNFFIPPFFYHSNQTQIKETKYFSTFLLFHLFSVFYTLTFLSYQPTDPKLERQENELTSVCSSSPRKKALLNEFYKFFFHVTMHNENYAFTSLSIKFPNTLKGYI